MGKQKKQKKPCELATPQDFLAPWQVLKHINLTKMAQPSEYL
jgi:hypothetical protein